MNRFHKGAIAVHPAYGRGTITALRCNGFEVRLSFGTFSLWVPARDLTPAQGGLRLVGQDGDGEPGAARTDRKPLEAILRLLQGDRAPAAGTGPAPAAGRPSSAVEPRYRPTRSDRPVEDAAVLESFRLGLVPTPQISEWTVGREEEVARIRDFLRDEAEGAILVEGAYGAGKSHLLQYLARDALGLGYAVAAAGFDPSEASAAFPKKAYRRLVAGFQATVAGQPADFRGFLRAVAADRAWEEVLGDHRLLAPFLGRLAAGSADEDDWDWIEARGRGCESRPTLHDYSTCANIYCNLLSALGRAAVEVAGLAGLVVLLDEAEVARSVMYRYQAARGMNFFRGLVMTANDDPVLLEEGLVRAGVTEGADSRLIYSGHNPVRYTAGIPSHLKVAFALTPGSLQDEFRRCRESIQVIPLDVLSMDQLRDLFGRVCDRFESVCGVRLLQRDRDRLFRLLASSDRVTSTRAFIKAAIEALDYIRFYPSGDVAQMIGGGYGG